MTFLSTLSSLQNSCVLVHSARFPKNEYQRLSKGFFLCSLVIVVPLICAPILLFLYNQILVLIANSEVAKQILIQFIFLFILLIWLLLKTILLKHETFFY